MLTNVILVVLGLVVLGLLVAVVESTVFSGSRRLRIRMRSAAPKMPKRRRFSGRKKEKKEEVIVSSQPTSDIVFGDRYGSGPHGIEEDLDVSAIEPEEVEIESDNQAGARIELPGAQATRPAAAAPPAHPQSPSSPMPWRMPSAAVSPVLPHGEKVQFSCAYPGAVSANQWY